MQLFAWSSLAKNKTSGTDSGCLEFPPPRIPQPAGVPPQLPQPFLDLAALSRHSRLGPHARMRLVIENNTLST